MAFFIYKLLETETTIYKEIRKIGLRLSAKEQSVIGYSVSEAYYFIFHTMPNKIFVAIPSNKGKGKKHNIQVNSYNIEFAPIIINCINDYLKKNPRNE